MANTAIESAEPLEALTHLLLDLVRHSLSTVSGLESRKVKMAMNARAFDLVQRVQHGVLLSKLGELMAGNLREEVAPKLYEILRGVSSGKENDVGVVYGIWSFTVQFEAYMRVIKDVTFVFAPLEKLTTEFTEDYESSLSYSLLGTFKDEVYLYRPQNVQNGGEKTMRDLLHDLSVSVGLWGVADPLFFKTVLDHGTHPAECIGLAPCEVLVSFFDALIVLGCDERYITHESLAYALSQGKGRAKPAMKPVIRSSPTSPQAG